MMGGNGYIKTLMTDDIGSCHIHIQIGKEEDHHHLRIYHSLRLKINIKFNIVFMVVIIYATKVHAYAIYSKSNLH